jgi:hypothetical protein
VHETVSSGIRLSWAGRVRETGPHAGVELGRRKWFGQKIGGAEFKAAAGVFFVAVGGEDNNGKGTPRLG